jgi:hypothetical protein
MEIARWRRWLTEPLVHFVAGGVLLFGVYRVVHRDVSGPIVVSAEQAARLRADHLRRTGEAATTAEAQSLLQRHIEEELLLREAARLHLADGDVIIRRRLLQKMQLLLEAQQPAPTDAELAAHFSRHPERFAGEPRVDLVIETPGSPLAGEQRGRTRAELARQFGAPFAARVWELPEESSTTIGGQTVRVTARHTPQITLADRRSEVAADLQRTRSQERLTRELAALRTRYRVEVQ